MDRRKYIEQGSSDFYLSDKICPAWTASSLGTDSKSLLFPRRTGDAYGYCLVASGPAGLALDSVMNDWDSGPFPPILVEAGGYFGDWQGNVTIHTKEALATT
jgi:fructose-1,6-bisphosphatase/inositol monophosphatase family enzyme